MRESRVHFRGRTGSDLLEVTSDLARVEAGGVWFLVADFEGRMAAMRFGNWELGEMPSGRWPAASGWASSCTAEQFQTAVGEIRAAIADGDVYQVNLCRQLRCPWPVGGEPFGLAALLASGNPAAYSAAVDVQDSRLAAIFGSEQLWIVSASPELFLEVSGRRVRSAPIKGTVPNGADFLEKDAAENIMIVDLVRNDLSAVCETGSVEVEHLLERTLHPGLDHLVSTVAGTLREGASLRDLFEATFPPGSVTGAPKAAALKVIKQHEAPRSFYCGTMGIVDSDAGKVELNVAIRTFWHSEGELLFGTGGGITWSSDPLGEWRETELKAARLTEVAGWSTS